MKIHENFDLSEIVYYKIGGKARFLIDIESKEDLIKAFELLKKEKVRDYFILGHGSNLILPDTYYGGAILRFLPGKNSIKLLKNNVIEAFAGDVLDKLIQFGFENNLTGLEWAGGLPGTVGAAVRGDVGAFGGEIKDVVKEVEVAEVVNGKLKFTILKRFELKFGYRSSLVKKKKLMVVNVWFRLKNAEQSAVQKARQNYISNIEYRKRRHPLEFPNCGSVFKNISDPEQIKAILEVYPELEEKVKRDWRGKVSMGYLIKWLEMDGFQIGSAQISPKHCNFIINLGGAKSEEVKSIIRRVQNKFHETFGFRPEVEVEII